MSAFSPFCVEKHKKIFNIQKITICSRMETFKFWKYEKTQSAASLASNGFYYINDRDLVTCFHCGLILGYWNKSNIPAVDNLRYSANCTFINLNKGLLQFDTSTEKLVPANLTEGRCV